MLAAQKLALRRIWTDDGGTGRFSDTSVSIFRFYRSSGSKGRPLAAGGVARPTTPASSARLSR
jgi:hypothetical protein